MALALLADRTRRAVAIFTLGYLVGTMVYALKIGNQEFLYYGAIMMVVITGVLVFDMRSKMPAWVLWGLSVWGLVHLLGGTLPIPLSITEPETTPVLYNMRAHPELPKFDQVVHAYGFGVATVAAWYGFAAAVRGAGGVPRPTFGPLVAVFLVGMGLGAFNELVEFVATRLMPKTNVGGYENTGWDLVSNAVGCLVAVVGIRMVGTPGAVTSAAFRTGHPPDEAPARRS